MSKLEEVKEKIEVQKDILSTLPKNNEKNIKKYNKKIDELVKEYNKYKEDILIVLKKRYDKETNVEENQEINNLDIRIKTIENILYLFEDNKDSYEKIELDRNIYNIGKYYKDNLENINRQILECIKKFHEVEIDLNSNDFNYSIYVKEYMIVFFDNINDINSKKLKEKFEELYWKCPDIIIHIGLNIRNLYFKYEQQIDKYLEKRKNELLKKWEKEPDQIMKSYYEIKIKKTEEIERNPKILIEKFINGKLNTKDYEKAKILKELKEIYNNEKLEILNSNEELKEIEDNIIKFLNSIKEYQNYLEYKFIVDDIKESYKEKDKYKKLYDETKKKIEKIEKKIIVINKKILKPGLFGTKKDNTNSLIEQNKLIIELNEMYKELDLNRMYNKISLNLKDNSTIYDILRLAASSYYYLVTLIIKNQQDILPEEIESKIEKLEKFLVNPNNNIINNITIQEEKDIGLIIKDKYKLSNFLLEKEDLEKDNLDNLIKTLENIKQYFNIKRAGIEIDKINELLEIKKIIKKD